MSLTDEYELLGATERLRADRLLRLQDRRQYVAAHAGARRVLARYLDVEPRSVQLQRAVCPKCGDADHGPPVIVQPLTELRYSLSHSGNQWMIAVGHGWEVGIDVESFRDIKGTSLFDAVLCDSERSAVERAHSPEARQRVFLRAWTRKEALLKAAGVGLAWNLREIDVQPESTGEVVVHCAFPWSRHKRWAITDLPCDGAAAALARPAFLTRQIVMGPERDPELPSHGSRPE